MKDIRRIHSWFGIAFGSIIFITCITGAFLVWFGKCGDAGTVAFKLHRWLMDAPAQRGDVTIGKWIVGISTLSFLIILISGLIMWWPRAKHGFIRSISIPKGSKGRKLISSLHVCLGFYSAIFLLIMAVTGLTWSFGWWRDCFYWLFQGESSEGFRCVVKGLHTGSIGGIATRIIWCLSALTGAFLSVSGYQLWIKRIIRKRIG